MGRPKMMAKEPKHSFHRIFSKKCLSQDAAFGDSEEVESLEEYYIPDYILLPESKRKEGFHVPACPVIVFINVKSGGQLGGELLLTYRSVLNGNQVFDLGEKAPDKVLHQLYFNLEKHKQIGDYLSVEIQRRLRIIVAGGDGTAGWILGVISDLKLAQPPPVVIMPLGTGNNIAFSIGWGKKNPNTNYQSVKKFLDQVKDAREMNVDSWQILMRMGVPRETLCDPIASLELPHAFHCVCPTDEQHKEGYHSFRGGFWNYFSMGMDAQVSYAFHRERNLHPEKFKNQFVNQTTYAKLGCTQGWFCAPLKHPSSRNIRQLAKIKIMKEPGQWIDLHVPRSIRSIVCLNLPSFSGGLNPWGRPSKKDLHSEFTPSYVNDGLLEVVGFRDAWHGLTLFAPNGHGTRLAQAKRIRFEFHKGAAAHIFMRIDGEPWKQPLPTDDETVVVEISHFGQVSMLSNQYSQPRTAAARCSSYSGWDDDGYNIVENGIERGSDERRRLGAAESF